MSNCYSSQAEYEDHDFKDGICKDCGTVDKPGVQEMAKRLEASRSEVERLLALNHRLANQIAGYGDRMQTMIGGVVKDAKVEALREASRAAYKDKRIQGLQRTVIGIWTNDRADNLEAS